MSLLTEDQQIVLEVARDFISEHFCSASGCDSMAPGMLPAAVCKMAEFGFMGMGVPAEYGGSAGEPVSFVAVVEEFSRACPAAGSLLAVHAYMVALPLLLHGSEEQRKRYLPGLAAGSLIGAVALPGQSFTEQPLKARLDDGKYLLNGSVPVCANAEPGGLFLVFSGEGQGNSILPFVLEKDTAGLSVVAGENCESCSLAFGARLTFENCEVPFDSLLGDASGGDEVLATALSAGKLAFSAHCVGISQAALDAACACVMQDKDVFGKKKVVEMSVRVEAARMLTRRAAAHAASSADYAVEAGMAKVFAGECAFWAASAACDVLGATGQTGDIFARNLLCNAKASELYPLSSAGEYLELAERLLA